MGVPHCYETTIREVHLDTFGHVNNARYLDLLEEARWEWITANGYGLREVQALAQGPTILQIEIKYRRELRNREPIRILSQVLSYAGRLGKLKQTIETLDGRVAAEAVLVCGLFDLERRKLIQPTPAWRRALGLDE